jgi:hypothetical protein
MQNREPTPKPAKHCIRVACNEHGRNPEVAGSYLCPSVEGRLLKLEKLINEESQVRQASYQELLGMIKHLEETKKAKININGGGERFERLFSPNKNSSKSRIIENDKMESIKKLTNALKADTENEVKKVSEQMEALEQ